MKEKTKTLTFLAVAATVWVLVLVTWPSLPVSSPDTFAISRSIPSSPIRCAVTNMEIVEFDDQRGEVHPLQVAQVDVMKGKTRWSIPSHDDYPADAKDQLAAAAAGLMGLKILDMLSDNQGDQQEYGVVDPDPKVLKVGATGVGQRVVMKDRTARNCWRW